MQHSRRNDLDLVKGIAIIAVVLYHMGILKSGYLGVDVFLVLGGFFIIPSIVEKVSRNQFQYFKFLIERIIRLLPAVLIASVLCLIIGFIFYLPDDYENMAESVFASLFFSNNILSAITTGNYWNTANDFKPFMHTWYLGILMEFYVIAPLLVMALKKAADIFKVKTRSMILGVLASNHSFVYVISIACSNSK